MNIFNIFKRKEDKLPERIEKYVGVRYVIRPKPHSKDELHRALAESVGR